MERARARPTGLRFVFELVAGRNAALTRRPLNRAPAGRTLRTQEMRRTWAFR